MEIPVEILIEPKKEEVSHMGVQTDQGNEERPVEIIVEKVIYVYKEEKPSSIHNKTNLN